MSDDNQNIPNQDQNQNMPTPDEPKSNPGAEEKSAPERVTVKKSTFKALIVGIVIALIAASFLGGYTLGQNTSKSISLENLNPGQTTQTNQPVSQASPPTKVFVSYKDSPMKGKQNAPVTMVEFSDFQCPFCGRFVAQTLPQVEQNYIDTGKVRLFYRDFPLENLHANAVAASLAAQCANEQNKFWQYHDTLFANQPHWEGLDSGNATDAFKQYAVLDGLDSNSFNTCLDSSKYFDIVKKNYQDGSRYNVSGTPTFFIGNDKDGYIQIVGAQPYSVFKQAIDQQLH